MRLSPFIRYTLYSLASTLFVLLVTLLCLFYFIDPNRLREPLTHFLNQSPAVKVHLGELTWKTFPLLGISAQNVHVDLQGNPIDIQSIEIYPDFTALLSRKRFELHKLVLTKPIVTIHYNEKKAKATSPTTPNTVEPKLLQNNLPLFALEHLVIEDANIYWGKEGPTLTQLKLDIKNIAVETPISITASTLWKYQGVEGSLRIHDTQLLLSSQLELQQWSPHIEISAQAQSAPAEFALETTVRSLKTKILELKPFRVQTGKDLIEGSILFNIQENNLEFSLNTQTIDVEHWLALFSTFKPLLQQAKTTVVTPSITPVAFEPSAPQLKWKGNFSAQTVHYQQTTLSNLHCTPDAQGSHIVVPCNATLYAGQLSARGQFNSNQGQQWTASLKQFVLEKAFGNPKLGLKGLGDLECSVTLPPAVHDPLNQFEATVTLHAAHGQILGIDVPYYLQLAQTMIQHSTPPGHPPASHTNFEQFHTTWHCQQGVCSSQDLHARSGALEVEGTGSISLRDHAIHYRLQGLLATQAKPLPLLLRIKGDLAHPSIQPDFEAYLQSFGKYQVEKAVDKLQHKLGTPLLKNLLP